MDVLMIGGTRFMGRIAVRKLLDEGDNVTVFSRGNIKPDWWNEIEHIQGDRDEIDDFKAKLKGKRFDAVIDSQAFRRDHVESAVTALQGNLGRYLIVSSIAVYLDGKGIDPFSQCPTKETDVNWESLDYTRPLKFQEVGNMDPGLEDEHPYSAGKRRAEKWLQESSPVPYTIMRIPAMLGEDDNEERSWWWTQRAMDGGPIIIPSEDRGMFRCLYATDAAEAFVRAIKEPKAANQAYNLASHEIIATEHWSELVCKIVGHESTLTFVPLEVILKHPDLRESERWFSRLGRHFPMIPDVSRAEQDFGFTTTPLETWVRSTVEWYMHQYEGEDSEGYQYRSAEVTLATQWREKLGKLVSDI